MSPTYKTAPTMTVAWYLHNEDWWQSVMDGSYQDWIKEQYSN